VLLEYIVTIALVHLYLLSMFGWGSLLLKAFPTSNRSFWDDITSRCVAGCGVLYALFIGLSIAGMLRPVEVGVLLACGSLVAAFFLPAIFKRPAGGAFWETTDRVLVVFICTLAALQFALGLTPLIFYDHQTYHLLAPAQFLNAGRLVHIPWNVQTNSPLALQLTVGMSLAVDPSGQVAKLLLTTLGCLLPLGVFEFVRPAGRRAGLLAALFVVCFPEFWIMQTLGVVDLPIAAFMVLGALWIRRAILRDELQNAVLAGIAFGIAIGSRYQAVILTSVFLILMFAENLILERQKWPDKRAVVKLCLCGVITALLVSPWLTRNYLDVGNPVYPLMEDALGGREWSVDQAARLSAEALGPRLNTLPTPQKILAPIMALLVLPSNGLFGMGLLFGSLLALAIADREVRLVALMGLAGLFIWGLIRPAAGVPLLRYNATSLVLLLTATGAMLAHKALLPKAGVRIAAVLAGGSVLIAVAEVQSIVPAVQSLVSPTARVALRDSSVPSWIAFQYVNNHLSADHDKLLLIGETRGFWLHVPYIAASSFNGPQLDAIFAGDNNPDYWMKSLRRLGVTHVLISNSELRRLHDSYGYLDLRLAQMETFNRWLNELPKVFDDGRDTAVLALETPFDEHVRSN
jgi:4-amino-4-deoxy-L-arabinose transferase-like glycosyltransferase